MILKKHILESLTILDKKYNNALRSPDPKDPLYYSKIASIEYAGWIEEAFDLIARRCVKNKLKTMSYKQRCHSHIENNFGFRYKENYIKMMSPIIGIYQLEAIENKLRSKMYLDILISELDNTADNRNESAHSYIHRTSLTIPAPSTYIASLRKMYPIITFIYSEAIDICNSY